MVFSLTSIKQLSLPIRDFGAPKKQQLELYVKYLKTCFDNEEAIVIHCYAGCGRTGVLLMVYLMVFEALNFTTALHSLRSIRSCAVETKIQENFLQTLDISSYQYLL